MKRLIVLGAVAGLCVTAPAQADPITPTQAAAEVGLAIAATNSANSYVWTTTEGARAAFNRVDRQYERAGLKVFGDISYFSINWPSARVREKVLGPRYLNNRSLEWASTTTYLDGLEIPLWANVVDPVLGRQGFIDNLPDPTQIASADKTAVASGFRYTINSTAGETTVYTTDSLGRVETLQTYQTQTWQYIPTTVTPPTPASTTGYPRLSQAIESATLQATLREVTRRAVTGRRGDSLRTMRVMARETVLFHNAGGEDEQVPIFVKLRIRNIPGGVRIYRKNPITGTFHEWRITQRGGAWRAYRTAP